MDKQTPLHLACKGNHLKIALLLLEEGADVTLTDKDGKTPAEVIPSVGAEPLRAALSAPPVCPSRPYYSLYLARQTPPDKPTLPSPDLTELETPTETNGHAEATPENESVDSKNNKSDVLSVLYGEKKSSKDSSVGPSLIFWPPVKHQRSHADLPSLELSRLSVTPMCISSGDVDIFPLLLSSGLIEVMDRFGLQGNPTLLFIAFVFLISFSFFQFK